MAPFNGIAKKLRSLTRNATVMQKRNSKADIPVTDHESPCHLQVDEEAPSSTSRLRDLEISCAELQSVVVEGLPKTPSVVKYDFQDPNGPPGQLYRGEFKGSKKHGSGAMSFAQDDPGARFMYTGNFIDDKMQGLGVLDWHDGKTYRGQFANNQMHGEGVMSWPDGTKYTGNYREGRKHGLGTVQYPTGSSYCGNFVKGKMHGEIVYTNQHGIEKLIRFREGKAMRHSISVVGDGVGNSEATTEVSSVCSGMRSVTFSGKGSGDGIPIDIASMLDDMCNGQELGGDDRELGVEDSDDGDRADKALPGSSLASQLITKTVGSDDMCNGQELNGVDTELEVEDSHDADGAAQALPGSSPTSPLITKTAGSRGTIVHVTL